MNRAGGLDFVGQSLFRRNVHYGQNTKTEPHALAAWCLAVVASAIEREPRAQYQSDIVTLEFLRRVADPSLHIDSSIQAHRFPRTHEMKIVRHLPKTYLHGAAIRMPDGSPVVGLIRKYDRAVPASRDLCRLARSGNEFFVRLGLSDWPAARGLTSATVQGNLAFDDFLFSRLRSIRHHHSKQFELPRRGGEGRASRRIEQKRHFRHFRANDVRSRQAPDRLMNLGKGSLIQSPAFQFQEHPPDPRLRTHGGP